MKLYILDIKKNEFLLEILKGNPTYAHLLTSQQGVFFLFYYDYDDKTSSIIIRGSEQTFNVSDNIYRKQIAYGVQNVGILKEPFDTTNIFFYTLLRSAIINNFKRTEELISVDLELLRQMFVKFKISDTEEQKNKSVQESNTYPIANITSIETALLRFILLKKYINGALKITELVNNYYKFKRGKSLYSDIHSIIKGMNNINGGFIPEANGRMRYMVIGEIGAKNAGDDSIVKAKEMLRSGADPKLIQLETGWYMNEKDSKWRKKISDKGFGLSSSLVGTDYHGETFFVFPDKKISNADILDFIVNSRSIITMIEKKYSTSILDIVQHPSLGKYYPILKETPMFFASCDRIPEQKYYFSPSPTPHIVIFGKDSDNLPTVCLHETQHCIQKIEGFSNGGNTSFSKLILAVGGGNVRKYFFALTALKKEFCEKIKGLQLSELKKFFQTIPYLVEKKLSTDDLGRVVLFCEEYEKKYKSNEEMWADCEDLYLTLMQFLSVTGVVENPETQVFILNNFGKKVLELFQETRRMNIETEKNTQKLIKQGWSEGRNGQPGDIQMLYFNVYKNLVGEIEARESQHSSEIPAELLNYFDFYTSETIDRRYITALPEGVYSEDPMSPVAALETDADGKYYIHLRVEASPEPYLHELGHIVYDLCQEYLEQIIEAYARVSALYSDMEEYFVAEFLAYIFYKDMDHALTEHFNKTPNKLRPTALQWIFDIVFRDNLTINESELKKRLSFIKKLLE